jgi:tellurite resistance protein
MELITPTSEQAFWGLRAMKTVALANGTLDASESHMLEAIQRVLGTSHPLDRLEPVTPAELASALPDPRIRRQLVQGLVVMSLVDREPSAEETVVVEEFARALDVSIPEVKDLRHALSGEIFQLRLDIGRRFWVVDKVKDLWNEEGLRGIFRFVSAALGREDSATASRYQALEK